MTEPLKWWAISAGTPDGGEGERGGSIRATTEDRARELYLSKRPSNWVIFSCVPGEEPTRLPDPPGGET